MVMFVFKNQNVFPPHPTHKILNKNMPNYNRFHVNFYLKMTCNTYTI